jgi:hypothetical protein
MGIDNKKFFGHFRGIVISNFDPAVKGRCKIHVPGVYPKEFRDNPTNLPWAEPAMPIFGGSYQSVQGAGKPETGVTAPPHIGAELWVFFEQGDHNYPIYCFAVQSGDGWMSEHKNQHVIQTDNVRIRIDEEPTLPVDGAPERSTAKFNSYNTNCTHLSRPLAQQSIPTRLDIDVLGNVNIVINGSTNILVNGNVFQEINGDKHETLVGNHYVQHIGDLHVVREGSVLYEQNGDTTEVINTGDYTKIRQGDEFINQTGNYNEYVSNNYTKFIGVTETRNVPTRQTTISQYDSRTVLGVNEKITKGTEIQTVEGYKTSTINGNYDTTCSANYNLNVGNSIFSTAGADRHDVAGTLHTNSVGTTFLVTAGGLAGMVAPIIQLN